MTDNITRREAFYLGLALLCLFALGLALALTPIYLYRQSGDGRWMAVSLAGWLIVSLVYQAARRGRK